MFAVKLTLLNQFPIIDFNRVGNQAIAGREGKVIPQILIAVKVNLAELSACGPARRQRNEYVPDDCRDDPTG